MRLPRTLPLAFLLLPLLGHASASSSADTPAKPPPKPCTLKSPLTGAYFDLNKISISPPSPPDGEGDGADSPKNGQRQVAGEVKAESWRARGYDYGANFTLNICAPVVEELGRVEGVGEEGDVLRTNISAFYVRNEKVYSIGRLSTEPLFRGKRMVLNYTDGSPCPVADSYDTTTNNNANNNASPSSPPTRRKSTIISFLCDRDMVSPPATVSFVGTMDECSYFFEVRSSAACGGVAAPAEGGLSPAGVFGVIALIAVAVYLLGGCAYQRTVMHQRGWRQLPNYTLWAGIASCFRDIAFSVLAALASALHLDRCVARLRGQDSLGGAAARGGGPFGRRARNRERYERLGGGGGGGGGAWADGLDVDEENRIIDQLDEEWED